LQERFEGDEIDILVRLPEVKELFFGVEYAYDARFSRLRSISHHYESNDHDDFGNTGYAVAEWLNENKDGKRAATIIVRATSTALIQMVENHPQTSQSMCCSMLDIKIKLLENAKREK